MMQEQSWLTSNACVRSGVPRELARMLLLLTQCMDAWLAHPKANLCTNHKFTRRPAAAVATCCSMLALRQFMQ